MPNTRPKLSCSKERAGDGDRTRDVQLGKLAFETITAVRRDFNRASGSLLRIEKEGGQVLWNVRFRRGELSYLDFGFPSSSKPSVLANCSCGKVCLDRTTAARWGPLSPCGG